MFAGRKILENTTKGLLNENFIRACRDYFYMLDRSYPERGSIKMVGDRYKLTRDQRTVLYRGISSLEKSEKRKLLLTSDITSRSLAVDGYNVLFSLLNYRLGRFTFISTDNILRDAGSLHGKLKDESTFQSCIKLMMDFLVSRLPSGVDIFFDSPVSHSEKHAREISELLENLNLTGSCRVIRSADYALRHLTYDVLATSDTGIIEYAGRPVADLPRMILEEQYHAELIEILDLIVSEENDNHVIF